MMVGNKEKNGIVAVKYFFGFAGIADFKAEWDKLNEDDKRDLTDGLQGTSPSFTY